MLERIEEIQGIGLLHEANGRPFTLRKGTFIYADNGRGKSTLASVLRSVSTGNRSLIANRRTLDGVLAPRVTLQFEAGRRVSYDDAAGWSAARPDISVFDADFVDRNVHSGGVVSTDHRKSLLEFALGESAVAARALVDTANIEARAATERLQAVELTLAAHHPGMALAQFERVAEVPDADAQIAALQGRIGVANNAAAITAATVPAAIPLPGLDIANLFTQLRVSFQNVHAAAEQIVRQHVQRLGGRDAENWLSRGVQFGNADTCPYCAQATNASELIRAYQTHFNAAYNDYKTQVAKLPGTVRAATDPAILERFSAATDTAQAIANGWQGHVQLQPIAFDAARATAILDQLRTGFDGLVTQKQGAPMDAVGTPEHEAFANTLWTDLHQLMAATNGQIQAAAAIINAYKAQIRGENVPQLQAQIRSLETAKRRHAPAVIALFQRRTAEQAASRAAETTKRTAREALDTLMEATLNQYQASINRLLGQFGAAFTIKGMSGNHRGAGPRTDYGLEIRGRDVALAGNEPSFSSALSEGDKRTLAFAFFVASALQDPNLGNKIIVIDDPMCSLDANRKGHTKNVLKLIHSRAAQLVVMAHDPHFLRDLRDLFLKADRDASLQFMQITYAPQRYSTFAEFDVDKECESKYSQQHRTLNEFDGTGNTLEVAKAIRPCLEGYLKRRFPGLIGQRLVFGDIVRKIRNAQQPSPLCFAKNLIEELHAINEYAGQFHHEREDDGDSPVAGELLDYVARSLHLMHSGVPRN